MDKTLQKIYSMSPEEIENGKKTYHDRRRNAGTCIG